MTDNPFDAYDEDLVGSGTLEAGPRPTAIERFTANAKSGFSNSIFGAAIDYAAPGEPSTRTREKAAWEAMPQWETPLEAMVSFSGQFVGSLPSVETIVPVGLGARLVGTAGLTATGLGARVLAGATDVAVVNAATDPVVQGLQIAGGTRESYDPMQTALAAGLGLTIGGAAPLAGAGLRRILPKADAVAEAPKPGEASRATPASEPAAPPVSDGAISEAGASARPASDVVSSPEPAAAPEARSTTAVDTSTAVEAPSARPAAPETSPPRQRAIPEPTPERPDAIRAAAEDAVGPDATFGDKMAAEAALREGRPSPVEMKAKTSEAVTGTPEAKGGDAAVSPSKTKPEAATPEAVTPDAMAMRAGSFAGEPKRRAAGVAETATDTTSDATPTFTRLKDAADALTEALDPAAVRQGRIGTVPGVQGSIAGIYKPGSGIVRVKNTQDFSVLTHELGHHLDTRLGSALDPWRATNAAALEPLAYLGTRPGHEVIEGFAEMARLFVTNPAHLEKRAPGLAASFTATMKTTAPDLLDAMLGARAAYADWLAQSSQRAVASTIVSAKRPGWMARASDALGDVKGTLADFFSSSYSFLLDDLHPISRTVDALTALYEKNHEGRLIDLAFARDPYKIARMARGAYSAGHADISFGVTPYHGTDPVSGSLRDALIEAQGGGNVFSRVDEGRLAAFGSYLWSRRALGEFDRFARGEIPNPPDKLTRGDHATNVADLEAKYPAFVSAAEKVYDWNRALWDKKRDAGLITEAQHADGLKIVDYVPGLRHFDEKEAKVSGRGAGRDGKGAMVRRFQGSDRDVINPIDSLVADAYQTAMTIARNDAVKALGRLADLAGPGAGRFVERIPAKEIRATLIAGDEAVAALAREAGLSGPDIAGFRDEVTDLLGGTLPEGFKLFRMGQINEKGEAIVWYREGGQLVPLRLADGREGARMLGAFDVMTRDEKAFLLEFLAKPASYLRLGITTHPTFLAANLARDQMASWVLYGKPFERVARTIGGSISDFAAGDVARAYMRVGGISGGTSTATLREGQVMRDTVAATTTGIRARLTTLSGFMEMTETAETATRLGNFRVFFDAAKGRGLNDWEATFEAAYRARDVLDFDRRGSGTMAIARIIPFLNASVQGLDKAARETLVPWAKSVTGAMPTAEDERTLANSGWVAARLGMATIATMGLWSIVSQHPDAADVSDRIRATHWVFPFMGEWVAIPKPFEWAAILNLGEAIWDGMAKHDPTAQGRYLSGLYDVLAPPSLTQGNPLIKTAFEAATGVDLFTGRSIVPDEMRAVEPWLQYTHLTSSIGRKIGAAADIPPVWVDHLVTSFGGSWGRSILAMSDWATGEKPAVGWWEAVLNRRFVKDASRGASSTRAFWDLVSSQTGKLETALRTWRTIHDEGRTWEGNEAFGRMDEMTRVYVAAHQYVGKRGEAVADLHPLIRARSAVQAISALRRDLADPTVTTSAGPVTISSMDRRRVDDVLSQLQMGEARNALIQVGAPGFVGVREAFDTDALVGELVAISPDAAVALADRYRTKRVLKREAVDEAWPELRARLAADGTEADVRGLAAVAHAKGFEYDGERIRPKGKAPLPGQR